MDGLVHPKSGLPMQESTRIRIQTNDERFIAEFRLCCDGHNGVPHDRLEGGDLTAQSAFYPKRFCERAAQLLMEDVKKKDLRHLHKVFLAMVDVIDEHDSDDNAVTFTELEIEEITETYFTIEEELVAPALSELLREPNEDGSEDETLLNRLRRVHANLGHPSNALLTRILKEAKAPDVVIDAVKDINCGT